MLNKLFGKRNTPGKIQTIKLEIDGMTCDHCATGIEKQVANLEGVLAARNQDGGVNLRHPAFARVPWALSRRRAAIQSPACYLSRRASRPALPAGGLTGSASLVTGRILPKMVGDAA